MNFLSSDHSRNRSARQLRCSAVLVLALNAGAVLPSAANAATAVKPTAKPIAGAVKPTTKTTVTPVKPTTKRAATANAAPTTTVKPRPGQQKTTTTRPGASVAPKPVVIADPDPTAGGTPEGMLRRAEIEVANARRAPNRAGLGRALQGLGYRLIVLKRYPEAVTALKESSVILATQAASLADTLKLLGWAYVESKQPGEAIPVLKRTVTLLEVPGGSISDRLSDSLQLLASAYRDTKDFPSAIAIYQRLAAEAAKGNKTLNEADIDDALGLALLLSGQGQQAIDPLNRAVSLRNGTDNLAFADSLRLLGWAQQTVNQHADALVNFKRSLEIRDRINRDGDGTSDTLSFIANSAQQTGDVAANVAARRRLVDLARKATPGLDLASALDDLGLAQLFNGQADGAVAPLREEVAIRRTKGDRKLLGTSLHNLAWSLSQSGNPDEAIDLFKEAVAIRESTDTAPEDLIATYRFLGYAYWGTAQSDQALPQFKKVEALLQNSPDKASYAQALTDLALAENLVSDHAAAIQPARDAVALWRSLKNTGEQLGAALHNLGWALYGVRSYLEASDVLAEAAAVRKAANSKYYGDSVELLAAARKAAGR
jgi:tetratricopeptide (TPR) repeat protein